MVDRIVPAASGVTSAEAAQALGVADQAALRTEAFWEWVIERQFVDETDAATLSAVGALPPHTCEIIGMQDVVHQTTARFEVQAYLAAGMPLQ